MRTGSFLVGRLGGENVLKYNYRDHPHCRIPHGSHLPWVVLASLPPPSQVNDTKYPNAIRFG